MPRSRDSLGIAVTAEGAEIDAHAVHFALWRQGLAAVIIVLAILGLVARSERYGKRGTQ